MSSTARADDEPLLTIEEYSRLPDDGFRSELVRGRVVREPFPGYEHGRLQFRLGEILRRYLREARLDHLVCVGNLGVITSQAMRTVRGPDAAVIRRDRLPEPHHPGFLPAAPALPIEVVSPSNKAADIQEKVVEYFAAGSETVWVVYPATRTIAVHSSAGSARFLREGEDLTGGDLIPGFSVPVASVFEDD